MVKKFGAVWSCIMKENVIFRYADENFSYHHTYTKNPDPAQFAFLSHSHNMYEIYLLISGKVEYIIEGRIFTPEPGTVMLTNKGAVHNTHITDSGADYERRVLMFSQEFIGSEFKSLFENASFRLSEMDLQFVNSCMEMIEQTNRILSTGKIISSVLSALLAKFSGIFFSDCAKTPVSDENLTVKKTVEFINANLDKKWNLDSLENTLYLDKAYISREFKRTVGCGIWDYTIRKRVFSAQQLMYSGKTITEAFTSSGFNDYSTFYRNYKKIIGQSPSDDTKKYRQSVQK